jgi:uncharacterized protein YegL
VYLVLDTSGSMSGEPIEAVRQGVKALLSDLRTDPTALESAYLSVITFASSAAQVCPLTELPSFQEPPLTAGGVTALGAGLKMLAANIDAEVRKPTKDEKGDWKPLVFLMTDGQPTDQWEDAADEIRNRRLNIIACAAGASADVNPLKKITETVVQLSDLQPDTLKAFFKWVSSSVKTTSQSITGGAEGPVILPPAPPQIVVTP